ncbi:MAG: glycosyltransferase [Clostridiaceae bacterium]|nr:glycosyltransferase [Clostridiaceae bacterium]
MSKVYVMLPCYNEEENITPLVEKWLSVSDEYLNNQYEFLIHCIDDKSQDQTLSKIVALTEKYAGRVFLIAHHQNKGLGGALETAFSTFVERAIFGDLCVLMDGDNTHDPKYFISMLEHIRKGSDVVIASRYRKGSKIYGVNALRQLLSIGARLYYSMILRVPGVRDYTCGYRTYTYKVLSDAYRRFGTPLVTRRSFACMMEALYKLSLVGAKFSEVPFELRYDHKLGESKMRIARTTKDSLKTAIELRRENKK